MVDEWLDDGLDEQWRWGAEGSKSNTVHFSFDLFFIARPWLHPSGHVAQGHAGRSQVVVLLLDVRVRVLETQRLDVVGDVGDASVEFLRA